MRPINPRAALRCELAITERCRCRCGGKLHGRRAASTLEGMSELMPTDPHYVAPERLRGHARLLIGVQTTLTPEVPERAIWAHRIV